MKNIRILSGSRKENGDKVSELHLGTVCVSEKYKKKDRFLSVYADTESAGETAMGLFDGLKKKKAAVPVIDEKKREEIARYQSEDHQVIRDLQIKPLGKDSTYISGRAWCRLCGNEIDVDLYDNVPLAYAAKCVEEMNSMPDELVDAICRAAKKYCLEFLDDIGGADLNDIRLTIPVDENTPPSEMLKCFEIGGMAVEIPEDPSRIAYQLSGNCDWEEEHGIEIDILDGRLVYLGEFAGESPWDDHSEESWNSAAHIYEGTER